MAAGGKGGKSENETRRYKLDGLESHFKATNRARKRATTFRNVSEWIAFVCAWKRSQGHFRIGSQTR